MINTSQKTRQNSHRRSQGVANLRIKNNENSNFLRPSLKFLMTTVPRRTIKLDQHIRTEPLQQMTQFPTRYLHIKTPLRDSQASLGNRMEAVQQYAPFSEKTYSAAQPLTPNIFNYPTFGKIESNQFISSSSEIIPRIQNSQSIVRPMLEVQNSRKSFKRNASIIRRMNQYQKLLENAKDIGKLLRDRRNFYENTEVLDNNKLVKEYEQIQMSSQNNSDDKIKNSHVNISSQSFQPVPLKKRFLEVISFSSKNTSSRGKNNLTMPTDLSINTNKIKKGILVLSEKNKKCLTERGDLLSDRSSLLYNRTTRIKTTLELENQEVDNQKQNCCD